MADKISKTLIGRKDKKRMKPEEMERVGRNYRAAMRTKTEGSFMGGGMMKKPMGYTDGGMCRGMGAAIKGGDFKGVK